MTDESETLLELRTREWAEWINRIFGSWNAHVASLPHGVWVREGSGWVSYPRD